MAISAIAGFTGCSSVPKTYSLPVDSEFLGFRIVDAVDKDTVFLKTALDDHEHIAVFMRDISTTAYSYIEPRYMNSMVKFEGSQRCCRMKENVPGNTGLVVYKFSFIGRGETTIHMIARHKGLSPTANSFDSDHESMIEIQVK